MSIRSPIGPSVYARAERNQDRRQVMRITVCKMTTEGSRLDMHVGKCPQGARQHRKRPATRAERSSSTSVGRAPIPSLTPSSRTPRITPSGDEGSGGRAETAAPSSSASTRFAGKDTDAGVLGIEQRHRFIGVSGSTRSKLFMPIVPPSRSISLLRLAPNSFAMRVVAEHRPSQPAKLARQANVCRIADGRPVLTGVGQIQARRGHHVSGEPNRVARDSGLDGAGRIYANDIDDDLEAQRQEGHLAREDGRVCRSPGPEGSRTLEYSGRGGPSDSERCCRSTSTLIPSRV